MENLWKSCGDGVHLQGGEKAAIIGPVTDLNQGHDCSGRSRRPELGLGTLFGIRHDRASGSRSALEAMGRPSCPCPELASDSGNPARRRGTMAAKLFLIKYSVTFWLAVRLYE